MANAVDIVWIFHSMTLNTIHILSVQSIISYQCQTKTFTPVHPPLSFYRNVVMFSYCNITLKEHAHDMPFVAKYFSLVFLLHYLVCKWSLFDMQWVFCRLPNTSISGYESNYKDIFEYIEIYNELDGKYNINHTTYVFPNNIIFLCFRSKYLPCYWRLRKGVMTQYW